MAVQPYLLILRNWASLMIFMRRPSTTTSRSVTNGSAERIAATADIILSAKHPVVVVLSAMSGATNSLLALSEGKGSQDSIIERHTATAESLL